MDICEMQARASQIVDHVNRIYSKKLMATVKRGFMYHKGNTVTALFDELKFDKSRIKSVGGGFTFIFRFDKPDKTYELCDQNEAVRYMNNIYNTLCEHHVFRTKIKGEFVKPVTSVAIPNAFKQLIMMTPKGEQIPFKHIFPLSLRHLHPDVCKVWLRLDLSDKPDRDQFVNYMASLSKKRKFGRRPFASSESSRQPEAVADLSIASATFIQSRDDQPEKTESVQWVKRKVTRSKRTTLFKQSLITSFCVTNQNIQQRSAQVNAMSDISLDLSMIEDQVYTEYTQTENYTVASPGMNSFVRDLNINQINECKHCAISKSPRSSDTIVSFQARRYIPESGSDGVLITHQLDNTRKYISKPQVNSSCNDLSSVPKHIEPDNQGHMDLLNMYCTDIINKRGSVDTISDFSKGNHVCEMRSNDSRQVSIQSKLSSTDKTLVSTDSPKDTEVGTITAQDLLSCLDWTSKTDNNREKFSYSSYSGYTNLSSSNCIDFTNLDSGMQLSSNPVHHTDIDLSLDLTLKDSHGSLNTYPNPSFSMSDWGNTSSQFGLY